MIAENLRKLGYYSYCGITCGINQFDIRPWPKNRKRDSEFGIGFKFHCSIIRI